MDQQTFEALKGIETIPELAKNPRHNYSICTLEERLDPIIQQNDIIIVAGAFFGDEGKGKTIDAIARNQLIQLIVRVNSGQNAGHTIYDPVRGIKFVTHAVPSGILLGKKCLINSECEIDPWTLMNDEIAQLVAHDIPYDKLYIGNVHIVTPYHKLLDFMRSPDNASTLQGISPAHSSKVSKTGLRLDDLFRPEQEQEKILLRDMETFWAMMQYKGYTNETLIEKIKDMNKEYTRFPEHILGFLKAEHKIKYLTDLYKKTVVDNKGFPKRTDSQRMIQDTAASGGKLLFELSQSILLSNAQGTHWRSSTSANTSAAGAYASAGLEPGRYRVVTINVQKTPPSRVGVGANPAGFVPQDYFSRQKIRTLDSLKGKCEDEAAIQSAYFSAVGPNGILEPREYIDKDGTRYLVGEAMAINQCVKLEECGATTKKPRVLGLLDCVMQGEVVRSQGKYVSISGIDRLDDWEKVGIIVGYVYHAPDNRESDSNGVVYKNSHIIHIGEPVPCDHVLKYCHPIIKVMKGWKGKPIAAGKRNPDEPLPKRLQAFIGEFDRLTGSETISIGNGKEPQDLIYIRRR